MNIHYMIGEYDYRIVALSIVVAILASYTALDLAGRIKAGRKGRGLGWLCAGALSMGTGVWSMHFVGMLAFKLPISMGYNFQLTGLSWLMAVVASMIALYIASRPALSLARLLAGATFMAAGIAGMHYTGMYAMRMQPGIVYDPWWVAASLVVAWTASAAALWIAFFLRDARHARGIINKAGAALLMGVAVTGMHYTAMAAAQFPIGSICGAASALDAGWLATLVAASSMVLLAIALAAAALDRRVEKRTAELVNSLRQANEELRYVSSHDPLTKLANRTLLQDRIEAALERWQQDQVTFAIAYVDLDGFKVLNDNLGHQQGDDLLRRAGQAMVGAVRHGDTVARIGGDEFVLVLNDMRTQEALAIACTRILDAIASIQEGSTRLSASIGSAFCPDDGTDESELMTASDLAMYAAKMAGKNRYQRYRHSMAEQISEEFHIQEDLREAIDSGQLVVYYQPKYTTAERELIGAEALVRWQHPEKGMIPPDRFIYIAERCGLINDLETYVLDCVCTHVRLWLDSGYQVPPISVNLSAVRIRDEDLPERVQACLDEHNVEPRYLMFEITESLAVREILRAINALKRFKAMGVDVALDDFGTGHSSLSYLKQLPIQQLKIDRSFIADLGQEDEDQVEIVRSIIGLAHALRLRVVAEGVETEEQLSCLNQFGCDEVQGYLFSRPIPAADFVRLICADRAQEPARSSKVVPLTP